MQIRKENELYKNLYDLDLGGELALSQSFSYTRVPGGWIMIKDNGVYGYSCYIPFSREFYNL